MSFDRGWELSVSKPYSDHFIVIYGGYVSHRQYRQLQRQQRARGE